MSLCDLRLHVVIRWVCVIRRDGKDIKNPRTGGRGLGKYHFRAAARFRMVGSRIFLRIRRFVGVTSNSSSVSMKSRHCSRERTLGGTSRSASSALEERVFVSCFFLHTFTSMSSLRPVWPTTIPAYTRSPGPINNVPRSWALNKPYVIASPASKAIRDPCLLYWISPL